ncbi:hypothetical protein [Caulobacter sp. NIBR2454]|uniref:hypothetical protein n=1 Tax=Caulobacter sp. NIBR2454 TaxID=3015996 RepID=UPI0022B714BD|nr:hypothetical protein [Caulobacter sp. NIBR2454]
MAAIDDHVRDVVFPALREYWEAETSLSEAVAENHENLREFRISVMRRARTASLELNHLADVALATGDPRLTVRTLDAVRDLVRKHCEYLRGGEACNDTALVRDVADAFKHHTLDRASSSVSGQEAVVACHSGYNDLPLGEGKYGGSEQVVVTLKDGTRRALTCILQNASDAWLRLLGSDLPELSMFPSDA